MPNKTLSNIIISVGALVILFIPIVAFAKAFAKNGDAKLNFTKPEIIERTEEVEEIEYVYLTPEPTMVSVQTTPNTINKSDIEKSNNINDRFEDKEDEDED